MSISDSFGKSMDLVTEAGWFKIFLFVLIINVPVGIADAFTFSLASIILFPFVAMMKVEAYMLVSDKRESQDDMIVDNTEELAADVTEFINSSFKVLDYSKAKCRRDTNYLLDAFSFDLNFGGNSASRWNADFYFWNQIYRLPEDQRTPTAKSYRQLGKICKDIVLGEYPGQSVLGELGTSVESTKVEGLANIFYETQLYNDTKYLPVLEEPDYTYSNLIFTDAQSIIGQRRKELQKDTVRFVNSEYDFIDTNLARRDARNLLTAVINDFAYDKFNPDVPQPTYSDNGSQNAVRTYTASFFDYDGTHVFPVFNPSDSSLGLKYKGSVATFGDLSSVTGMKPKWAYIVATDYATSFYAGDIYYWDGSLGRRWTLVMA